MKSTGRMNWMVLALAGALALAAGCGRKAGTPAQDEARARSSWPM